MNSKIVNTIFEILNGARNKDYCVNNLYSKFNNSKINYK